MSDVGRALEQIEQIHAHLAKAEVYRGWRPVPVASSALVGIAAAWWQSLSRTLITPVAFVRYWLIVAAVALTVGCSEIVWHYLARATESERRRSRQVIGQFFPALVAGALITAAIVRAGAGVHLLPGMWALLFGVAIFAARPFIPRTSTYVALYYWITGGVLLWSASPQTPSPWSVGATFGIGQLLAAAALSRKQGD